MKQIAATHNLAQVWFRSACPSGNKCYGHKGFDRVRNGSTALPHLSSSLSYIAVKFLPRTNLWRLDQKKFTADKKGISKDTRGCFLTMIRSGAVPKGIILIFR